MIIRTNLCFTSGRPGQLNEHLGRVKRLRKLFVEWFLFQAMFKREIDATSIGSYYPETLAIVTVWSSSDFEAGNTNSDFFF